MLGSVTRPDGKVVTFKYDALGRRIEKTFNGRVHRYLWDGDVVLHEWEYDETERPQQIVAENGEVSFDRPEPTDNLVTWVYDTDGYVPTAKLVDGKRYGIVSDYIGRPVQACDEHGTPVWQADYDIYGNLLNLKGDRGLVPFRQLGQYEDEETGLYYNRFRYYDPNTGGYISQDPIGLAGKNPTLYGYVRDVNIWVDVSGLDCSIKDKKVATPYGDAIQSIEPEALKARTEVENGATLYRIGTMGRSETIGAQFWALEHPFSEGYASRYGIPPENVANSNFIMTGKLKEGSDFITRPAPPVGTNSGGGIEVVTPTDGVEIITFSTL